MEDGVGFPAPDCGGEGRGSSHYYCCCKYGEFNHFYIAFETPMAHVISQHDIFKGESDIVGDGIFCPQEVQPARLDHQGEE